MYNQYYFYGVSAVTEAALIFVLSLQTLSFVFYVYRPKQVNAEGIGDGLADFRRELALVRKYDNTSTNPRNEGFYLFRVFLLFSSKIYF